MPDDIIDPVPTTRNEPAPRAVGMPRKVICQFCDCELAIDGMVLKGSEKAKKMRVADELIEEKERTIAALRQEITTLKAARESIPEPVRSGRGLTF